MDLEPFNPEWNERILFTSLGDQSTQIWQLIMSWTQQKSENRNIVIASVRPRDLTFICPTAAKNFPTHQVFGLIVIQL